LNIKFFWHLNFIHHINYVELNTYHVHSKPLYILLSFAIIKMFWIYFEFWDYCLIWFDLIFLDRMFEIACVHFCNVSCTSNCLSSLWNAPYWCKKPIYVCLPNWYMFSKFCIYHYLDAMIKLIISPTTMCNVNLISKM